ncbi:MAG: flagellar biosynthesis protein FlhB [Novosphingobium sp.]|nr:EscU/YscU/HrcU family type III secretion system export apparatus switch protein [Novosphingobium sp.]
MSEQGGEKTFDPTPKRKADAAQKGDVLRSREVGTAIAVLIGALWLKFAGPWLLETLESSMRAGFSWDRAAIDDFAPGQAMLAVLLAVTPPVLILATAVLILTMAGTLALGDGRWIGANLLPKGSRLDPIAGLKRMFGATGWIEAGKGLLKLVLLSTIAWFWGKSWLNDLMALGRGASIGPQLALAWQALTGLLLALGAGLLLIAVIDWPVQWVRRIMRLKMTAQEVRDEHKEAEGSPEKKMAIRQKQRQLAMGGVAKAMREAQFVLTNPSHFSVAMAYDPARAAAPIVLAKGRGDKALAMRELASELQVPTLEYPALARSVYFTTRENQVIREELYAAVAGVLAFVLSLKRGESPVRPAIEVPVALRFDANGRLDPAART